MASVTSATAATLISNIWSEEIEYAANDVRGVVNFVVDTGEKYFGPGGGNILFPNVGSIAARAYSAGTVSLTFYQRLQVRVAALLWMTFAKN